MVRSVVRYCILSGRTNGLFEEHLKHTREKVTVAAPTASIILHVPTASSTLYLQHERYVRFGGGRG